MCAGPQEGKSPGSMSRGGLTPIPEGPWRHLEARQIRSQPRALPERGISTISRGDLLSAACGSTRLALGFHLAVDLPSVPWAKYLLSHCEPEVVLPEGGGDGARGSVQTVPLVLRPYLPCHGHQHGRGIGSTGLRTATVTSQLCDEWQVT